MSTEKVMSVYNLQDEVRLGAVLNGVEGLSFEKIDAEACNGEEGTRYHVSMDEILASGQLLGSIAQFVQENEGVKVRFCNPGNAGLVEGVTRK